MESSNEDCFKWHKIFRIIIVFLSVDRGVVIKPAFSWSISKLIIPTEIVNLPQSASNKIDLVRVAPDCNRSYYEDSFSGYSGSV